MCGDDSDHGRSSSELLTSLALELSVKSFHFQLFDMLFSEMICYNLLF